MSVVLAAASSLKSGLVMCAARLLSNMEILARRITVACNHSPNISTPYTCAARPVMRSRGVCDTLCMHVAGDHSQCPITPTVSADGHARPPTAPTASQVPAPTHCSYI